jgi:acetate kinase
MTRHVLALNAGSSTLKHAIYRADGSEPVEVDAETMAGAGDWAKRLGSVEDRYRALTGAEPELVAHRLVHGGTRFAAPHVVDDALLVALDELAPLAPLHLPPAIELVRAARKLWPRAHQVACFDTAFHRNLPEHSARFPIPRELHERGVHRYGFHGLSYEYIVSALRPLPERLIVAHLGSGASMAAIRAGRSLDTTMGLTPCGGIPMGTRSGDLDPGVLIHLMRHHGYSVDGLEHLLDHEAGLRALGGSASVAELEQRRARGDEQASFALESFGYALRKQIGAYYAALGGLDCLVFTGGIGEHSGLVRELSCQGLAGIGIELDAALNTENAPIISRAGARCSVRVMATSEGLVLARAALALSR